MKHAVGSAWSFVRLGARSSAECCLVFVLFSLPCLHTLLLCLDLELRVCLIIGSCYQMPFSFSFKGHSKQMMELLFLH